MKFTPGNEWSWGYSSERNGVSSLILNISDDAGKRYVFTTHYTTADLREFPVAGQSFCIEDAALLTQFQEGLYSIKVVQDEVCLPLALNALACARFVKLPRPCGRLFLPFAGNEIPQRGQVVSIYSKDGGVGDFMVLDAVPDGDVYRVMLLNQEWDLEHLVLKAGAMIRVPQNCLCAYRSISLQRYARYA